MLIRILCFLCLCLFACNSPQKPTGDNMAQFTKDKDFKAAHETPEKINHTEKGQMITFDTPDGRKGSAYALKNAIKTNNYIFVIHEWWGLNDHIKEEGEQLFEAFGNVHVLALDLYDGKVADNREDAAKYMGAVKEERAEAIIKGALAHAGADARIGTIGWCFGGGWSLKSSILSGEQAVACVMYYGMPVQDASKLVPLKAPVLGIFGEQDGWITPEVVNKFEALMKATGKSVQTKQFKANHGFANPSSPRYDEAAAKEANAMARSFLKEKMGE